MKILTLSTRYFLILMLFLALTAIFIDSKKELNNNNKALAKQYRIYGICFIAIGIILFVLRVLS